MMERRKDHSRRLEGLTKKISTVNEEMAKWDIELYAVGIDPETIDASSTGTVQNLEIQETEPDENGWQILFDETQNAYYYYNIYTEEAQWIEQ